MTDQPSHIVRSTDEELDQLFAKPPATAKPPGSLAVELAEHLRATSLPARPEWDSTPHLAHGEHQYDGACAICRTADRHALPVVVQAVLDRLAEVGRDDATTSPLCPRCYSEGRDGCCLALEWRRTRAAAEGAPDPADAGLPLWQQVDRGWSRRYDADQRAWQRERDDAAETLERHRADAALRGRELDQARAEIREHEQHGKLLRAKIAELEVGNDALIEHGEILASERDQARAEVESLRATVRGLTAQTQAYVDRAKAEGARIVELAGEVERLRNIVPVLVGNAIDAGASNDGEAIARLNVTAAAVVEPGVLVNPEAERLQGLLAEALAEALDGWQYVATTADHGDRDIARIAELRREEGVE